MERQQPRLLQLNILHRHYADNGVIEGLRQHIPIGSKLPDKTKDENWSSDTTFMGVS